MLLGFLVLDAVPFLGFILVLAGVPVGRYIGGLIEEERERSKEEARRREYERQRQENQRQENQRQEELSRRREQRSEVNRLIAQYPCASKEYFRTLFGISSLTISDAMLTDDRVTTFLSKKYLLPSEESKLNAAYRARIEAEKEAIRLEQERKRQAALAEERRRLNELRELPTTLSNCVSSWKTHSCSDIKHYWFHDYYPYRDYKDCATASMRRAWILIWNFKNDPAKVTSFDHKAALDEAVELVTTKLSNTFGDKVKYLTLVCLSASTQSKTDLRFKDFASRVCQNLGMVNAYDKIRVTADGSAKHEGGTGVGEKSYDASLFYGKNVILFDDVRTSGRSLDSEKSTLEGLCSHVIGAITLGQTTH